MFFLSFSFWKVSSFGTHDYDCSLVSVSNIIVFLFAAFGKRRWFLQRCGCIEFVATIKWSWFWSETRSTLLCCFFFFGSSMVCSWCNTVFKSSWCWCSLFSLSNHVKLLTTCFLLVSCMYWMIGFCSLLPLLFVASGKLLIHRKKATKIYLSSFVLLLC